MHTITHPVQKHFIAHVTRENGRVIGYLWDDHKGKSQSFNVQEKPYREFQVRTGPVSARYNLKFLLPPKG